MFWKQLWATKSLETLHKEMEGENRLRRVLGPIALTSLGIGAVIGAGIFVTTGKTAANVAGPAVMISYAVAGLGCALAALCYAEFASMAPVAGSAYTYAYATLGELLAWIIGWDLVLEYAMSCAVLASDWTKYFNVFLDVFFKWRIPERLSSETFSSVEGAWFSLPAVVIMALATFVLVIGIRESATTNAILVAVKVGVVLFVIAVGVWYVNPANWTSIKPDQRKIADVGDLLRRRPDVARLLPPGEHRTLSGKALLKEHPEVAEVLAGTVEDEIRKMPDASVLRGRTDLARLLPEGDYGHMTGAELLDKHPEAREALRKRIREEVSDYPSEDDKWGMIALLGLHERLEAVDDRVRSPFLPYGLAGVLAAAAMVFFAYIGFDAISTHSEEAKRPQRDVPIGIIASLVICTILYFGVSAVITGMEPYPLIDTEAAVAEAFHRLALTHQSVALQLSAGLIAVGALAGMTSVILITLLSQARIFLAMARDGLLPPAVFGAVHPRFRTPYISTMLTGGLLCVLTAVAPMDWLFNMVNIGTLLAFLIVCAAVLILRLRRPEAPRPFRCPWLYVVGPLGILVNLLMMLFLPIDTWLRLVGWLVLGLVIFIGYGFRHSALGQRQWRQANGLGLEGEGDAYYRSETYRRRLASSLWFCLIAAGIVSGVFGWLLWLWWAGTPVNVFPDVNPIVVLLVAGGIDVFLVLMLAMNLREWVRLRAT
jgi:APA family basic amino acid/polyamine antiporter